MNVVLLKDRSVRECIACGARVSNVCWADDLGNKTWVPERHNAPNGKVCSNDATSRIPTASDHWPTAEEVAARRTSMPEETPPTPATETTGTWKKVTAYFVLVVAAVIIAYDIFVAFFNTEKRDTISQLVQRWAYDHWSVPFFFGAVFVGHFFLYGSPIFRQPWAFLMAAGVLTVLVVLDALGLTPAVNPIWLLLVGVLAGRLCWPQLPL